MASIILPHFKLLQVFSHPREIDAKGCQPEKIEYGCTIHKARRIVDMPASLILLKILWRRGCPLLKRSAIQQTAIGMWALDRVRLWFSVYLGSTEELWNARLFKQGAAVAPLAWIVRNTYLGRGAQFKTSKR